MPNEHKRHGFPFPPIGERADMLEETLEILRGLWEGPTAGPTAATITPSMTRSSGRSRHRCRCRDGRQIRILTADLYAGGVLGLTENDLCYSVAKLFFAYGLGTP